MNALSWMPVKPPLDPVDVDRRDLPVDLREQRPAVGRALGGQADGQGQLLDAEARRRSGPA